MEIDAMQYASMSRELLRGDNLLHFFDNGDAYLDKPPLIFWITALFFKIFGASDLVYRLPSVLFSILTLYSTYQFSKRYYSEQTATLATVILASCVAFFVMNGDVRADIYMIGPMMTAIWQLDLFFKYNHWKNLIISSIAISLAMMGKGPIGMVIPIFVIGIDLIFKNKLKLILNTKLFFGFVTILFCMLPMSYGLYTQFGLSGLEFFYWIQSFGRITGENPWSNNTGPMYLFNVFLYSFLPWTIIFLFAFIKRSQDLVYNKFLTSKSEIISYSGFIIPLIIFSLSNYKLPHYIYCVVPFAAILLASKIEEWNENEKIYHRIYFTQWVVVIIIVLFIYGLVSYIFPPQSTFFLIPLMIILLFMGFELYLKNNKMVRFLIPSIAGCILINYGFNIGIIRPLMTYQAPSQAAKYLEEKNNNDIKIYLYNENHKSKSRSFNFYLNCNTKYIDRDFLELKNDQSPLLIFTNEKGYNYLVNQNQNIEVIKIFDHVRVSKIQKLFLNPETRKTTLKKKFLLKYSLI